MVIKEFWVGWAGTKAATPSVTMMDILGYSNDKSCGRTAGPVKHSCVKEITVVMLGWDWDEIVIQFPVVFLSR